jgi:LysR family nitrogen assimilation transcriptional regulator
MTFELRQLRYFVAIFEEGSVTKAAMRLFVAQSALSSQLAQLEDELGVQLLTRSPQGVSPTAFGQTFYEHAIAILKHVTDAIEAVRQHGQSLQGTVVVGMPECISVVLGLPLLTAATQRFPELCLRLSEDPSGILKDHLKEGKLNMAIVFDDGRLEGLSTEPLVDERLYLISRDRRAAISDTVPLATALACPLILPDERDGFRAQIDHLARNTGIGIPHLVSEISSLSVLKSAVLQGMASTIMPISSVQPEIDQGLLHAQEIDDPRAFSRVALCTRKNDLLDRTAASVFRLLTATAKELCGNGQWSGAVVAREDKTA